MPTKERYAKDREKCRLEAMLYYRRNREKRKAYSRAWAKSPQGRLVVTNGRRRLQWRLSARAYADLFDQFNGQCAVCHSDQPRTGKKRLCVDHDHVTGNIRGVLCFSCNVAIGSAKESAARLRALADYLSRPQIIVEPYIKRHRRTAAEIQLALDNLLSSRA